MALDMYVVLMQQCFCLQGICAWSELSEVIVLLSNTCSNHLIILYY